MILIDALTPMRSSRPSDCAGAAVRPRQYRRIQHERIEPLTVQDLYHAMIDKSNDAAACKRAEGPADRFRRHADIVGDVRPAHRDLERVDRLLAGQLMLFEQLKEQRHLRQRTVVVQEEGVTLRFAELVAKLGDDVEL